MMRLTCPGQYPGTWGKSADMAGYKDGSEKV